MLVFIDESGCSGFKLARGSDAVFAIGMVIFDDSCSAARTEQRIAGLRQRHRYHREFRFSNTSDRMRESYFVAVADCAFSIRALIVEKSRVERLSIEYPRQAFHGLFLTQLVQRAAGRLNNATLSLDGTASRKFERALKSQLRQCVGSRLSELRIVDSRRNELIQLADMCIGGIARAFRPHHQSDRWLRLLSPRVEDICEIK